MRLRNTKQVGEFDVSCLFPEGVEAEIWASLDMAEDLPSSCTFYGGGAVNRANLPMVVFDPRRQPKTSQTEDDAGKARMEEETQLRERIRVGAVEWPAPTVASTMGSTSATASVGTTGVTTPPAQSTVTVVTKGGSAVVPQGSPGLQALAAVAAQVDRQVGSTLLPSIATIFPKGPSGAARGQAVVGTGTAQQRIPGIVYPSVPGLASLMLPNDPITQRCAAGLAHILGPRVLYLVGAAGVGPPAQYVPAPVSATSPSPTPSEPERLVIVTSPSTTSTAPAGPLSAPALLPSAVVVMGSATSAASSTTSVGAVLGAAAARGRTTSARGRHDTI